MQVRPVQQGAEPGALQPPADAQQQATRHPISALRHQVRARAGNTGSSRLTQGLRGVQERRYSGDAFLDISFVDFHVEVSVIEFQYGQRSHDYCGGWCRIVGRRARDYHGVT